MIENVRDRIAYIQHDALDRTCLMSALLGIRTIATFLIGGFADAGDRRQWAVKNANDLTQCNLMWRFNKTVASRDSTAAGQQACVFEREQNLFKKFDGNVLSFRNLLPLQQVMAIVGSQLRESPERILAFL